MISLTYLLNVTTRYENTTQNLNDITTNREHSKQVTRVWSTDQKARCSYQLIVAGITDTYSIVERFDACSTDDVPNHDLTVMPST